MTTLHDYLGDEVQEPLMRVRAAIDLIDDFVSPLFEESEAIIHPDTVVDFVRLLNDELSKAMDSLSDAMIAIEKPHDAEELLKKK